MSEVTISPGTAAEREWAARLMAASDPWVRLGRDLERCRATCLHPEYELFVATAGAQPLGFILLHPRGAMSSPYIASVAVAVESRGLGLGTALLRFAEDHYRHGAKHILLCVSSFNGGARRLYERLGYEVAGELKDYVIPGASEILMHKWLR